MGNTEISTQTPQLPHVVIVGGGFGGLNAALTLRKAPVRITLIDRTNHHLFQPLLYQVATAGLSPAEIATPIRHVLRNQKNAHVLMAEVTGVDTQARRVLLGNDSLPYDYLILATGSRQSYFGHDEWEKLAPGLKTITDATSVRQRILQVFEAAEAERDPERVKELMTFVLVGAGPTGSEMAGAIAELAHNSLRADFRHINPEQTRILLIEAGPRILSAFPEDLSKAAQKKLEEMGVEVRTNTPVEKVKATGVILKGGEQIGSDTIIWTAGNAASPAGKWLNAPTDRAGRVKVNPDLSVPEHPEIFVIGDTMTLEQDGKPLPGVAQVAIQQGKYIGKVVQNLVTRRPALPPFRYWDKGNLATIGRSFAIADLGKIKLAGFFAWVLWLFIHILYLIGFRNRILVLTQWAWAYLTFQRGVRVLNPEYVTVKPHIPPEGLDGPAFPGPEPTAPQKTETER